MSHKVSIYCDGASSGNPGPGGYGVVLLSGRHRKELSEGYKLTTNNRMELMAAIKALEELKRPCRIQLTTDSTYVKNGITQWLPDWKSRNWRTAGKKPVKNVDLWQLLDAVTGKHEIEWHWVKGHSGHPENELADRLANQAIDDLLANR